MTVAPTLTAVLGIGLLVLALALIHVPLGTWMHRVYTDERHWAPERLAYRVMGVSPDSPQTWRSYAASVLAFSLVSILGLWALITVQGWLPLSLDREMTWWTALNTAVSFTTNTNWQSYAGEAGAGHVVQALGLAVQNFVSAAVGMAVAVALVRGIATGDMGIAKVPFPHPVVLRDDTYHNRWASSATASTTASVTSTHTSTPRAGSARSPHTRPTASHDSARAGG